MPVSTIDAVNLSLLTLTFALSYLSYASQARDTVETTLARLEDVEYSAESKLTVSLYDYRFRLLDSRSRTTLLFREYEWGSETPWAGQPAEIFSGTEQFDYAEGESHEQNRERRRRAAEVIVEHAIEEFGAGFDDERDEAYWRDLVSDVELTNEGLVVVCHGRSPVDVRRVSDAILRSVRAYATIHAQRE